MKLNGIIERKVRTIEENIEAIKSWQIESFQQFSESSLLQKATERALQISIEVMIDISERILALNKLTPEDTSVENMQKLEKLGVIQSANDYADMIRFRNFIVHRYEKVDTEIVYSIIKNKLNLFDKFVEEIRSYKLP
ncbi:MAG: type VII toxin-antitoxin system HepT family RNase toxin [Mariniphaga sp.]